MCSKKIWKKSIEGVGKLSCDRECICRLVKQRTSGQLPWLTFFHTVEQRLTFFHTVEQNQAIERYLQKVSKYWLYVNNFYSYIAQSYPPRPFEIHSMNNKKLHCNYEATTNQQNGTHFLNEERKYESLTLGKPWKYKSPPVEGEETISQHCSIPQWLVQERQSTFPHTIWNSY